MDRSSPERRGGAGRLALVVLASALVWVLLGAGIWRVLPGAAPQVRWDASSAVPPPGDFRYLMFPADGSVTLHAAPGGPVAGTLARAVANTQEEVVTGGTGGWVTVQGPPSVTWVRLDRLAYEPPADSTVDYAAACERAYIARAPGGARLMRFRLGPDGPEGRPAVLRMVHDDGWEQWEYVVKPGAAVPQRWLVMHGPSAAPHEAMRAVVAVVGSTALTPVLLLGVWVVRRPRRAADRPGAGLGA